LAVPSKTASARNIVITSCCVRCGMLALIISME
jgi:hypothetical protein